MFRIDRRYVHFDDGHIEREQAELEEEKKRQKQLQEEMEAEARIELENTLRVIRERDAESEKQALELIAVAEQRAAELIDSARAEAETIREQARTEGYNAGYKAGEAEMEDKLAKARQSDEAAFTNLMSELAAAKGQLLSGIEDDILELTLAIVRKIFYESNRLDGSMFEAMVVAALTKLKKEGKITIRVSPFEFERFFSSGSAPIKLHDETITVSVTEDVSLPEGGLAIDSEGETVNAGFESQMKHIEIAFRQVE